MNTIGSNDDQEGVPDVKWVWELPGRDPSVRDVLARLDQIEAKLDALNARMDADEVARS